MVRIEDPQYENFRITCDHCASSQVIHRRDDLNDPNPIAGRSIRCGVCDEELWVTGDLACTTYQYFIADADRAFASKDYRSCITKLGQAWEVFLFTCLQSSYVYRPLFNGDQEWQGAAGLNGLMKALASQLSRKTFSDLRNLVIQSEARAIHPRNAVEAKECISGIQSLLGKAVQLPEVEMDQTLRTLAAELQALTVWGVRNSVIHKTAYIPSRAEVERCLEAELDVLYRTKFLLSVGGFLEHSAGLADECLIHHPN